MDAFDAKKSARGKLLLILFKLVTRGIQFVRIIWNSKD